MPANCKSWRISRSLSDLSEQYLFMMCLFLFLQTHFCVDLNLLFRAFRKLIATSWAQKPSWLQQRSCLTSGVIECCQRSWVSVAAIFFSFKKLPPSCFWVGNSAPFFLKKQIFEKSKLFFCCWYINSFFFWPKGLHQFCCVFPFFKALGVFSSQPALGNVVFRVPCQQHNDVLSMKLPPLGKDIEGGSYQLPFVSS